MILVTGATGNNGTELIKLLSGGGVTVRGRSVSGMVARTPPCPASSSRQRISTTRRPSAARSMASNEHSL
jgi:nucleoside-diphosphate-sugar epimerase